MDKISEYLSMWSNELLFSLTGSQIFGLFLIVFISYIVDGVIKKYFIEIIKKVFQKRQWQIPEDSLTKIVKSFGPVIFSFLWFSGIPLLGLEEGVSKIMIKGGDVIFAVSILILGNHTVDLASLYFRKKAAETENKFDDILVPLVHRAAKTMVYAFGIVFIGNTLNLDMKGLITGLGIGGIAFALAAKDTISNLFGSFTVILDRPFSIGDWVVINGESEGIVEDVGLRSTKIRTFYDSVIYIPNGSLTNATIDNYGRRKYRRLSTKIGVEYSTDPATLEKFCEGIREIILRHPKTRKDYFHIYFNEFGNSSLNILLYVFWEVADWAAELEERHRLLLDILKLGNEMGVNFAFPTQTLHLASAPALSPTDNSQWAPDHHHP